MDKYFICLANSYKRGGRCVAGIEIAKKANGKWKMVRGQEGFPQWVRPIANTPNGEIPTHLANGIDLLSVVKLADVQPCPHRVHTEDVLFSQIECCQVDIPHDIDLLDRLIDPIHQGIFHSRGSAISTHLLTGLNYSLMFIHPENIQTYIDETRKKSKYRMSFTYFGTDYDLPITDPGFLDKMREAPQLYTKIDDAYLTLSLGMEFEGWHHKLVAGVIIPDQTTTTGGTQDVEEDLGLKGCQQPSDFPASIKSEDITKTSPTDWLDDYDKELKALTEMKDAIEEKIKALRKSIQKEMERQKEHKVESQNFTIYYTPGKTVMQFDKDAFRRENEELYAAYCKAKQKKGSLVIKRMNKE